MEKTKEERQSGSSVEEDGGSAGSAAAAGVKKGKLSLQKQNMDGKRTRLTPSQVDLDETGDFKDGHMFSMTSTSRRQAVSKSRHRDEVVKGKVSRSEGAVVARKKKTIESRNKKVVESRVEVDEDKDETSDGQHPSAGKHRDVDPNPNPGQHQSAGKPRDVDPNPNPGQHQSAGKPRDVDPNPNPGQHQSAGKPRDIDRTGDKTGARGAVIPGAVTNVRSCPTCKHLMADEVFKDHIKECLQQFHITSADRRRKVAVMCAEKEEKMDRRHRNVCLVKEGGCDVVTDEDYFLCQICQKDLSHMNSQRRTQHMNRCIDEAQMNDKKLEKKPESGESGQLIVLDCPMCGKPLKTESSRKVHLKQCARMLNVTTEMMLQAVKAQEEEHQMKMAAGIAPQLSREVSKKKSAAGTQGKKQTKKKAKGPMDDDTQLAMALSSSLADEERKKEQSMIGQLNLRGIGNIAQGKDKEAKKKTRKKKNQQGAPPPLLLQLSKTEAQQRIADKVTQLVVPQVSVGDPRSTPPIVDSRLMDLPGTKVFVIEQENPESLSTLWRRTALHAGDVQDVQALYYTKALMPPVCVSNVTVGSKLKHMSQIPGRRKSEEQEQNCQEGMVMSQTSEDVASTPTAMLLAELAAEAGDSSCEVNTGADDNAVEVTDEGAAVTPDDLRDASGFCPEEPVYINKVVSAEAMSVLQSHYLSLVDQEESSDVAIETKDQNVVHAHQLILSVRCPQLLKLTRRGVAHLLNSSRDAVLTVMKFVYGGAICLQPSLIAEVKSLAQQLCVTDLAAYCDIASQELKQTDKQTDIQTDMPTDMQTDIHTKVRDNSEPRSSHRLTSVEDICQEMFSDSDLDPQGEKGACKEGEESDEDEWREVYCSQRQQLQRRRQSLGDLVVEGDEVGDIGRHGGELDTVEYVEEKVTVGDEGHNSAGAAPGLASVDRPAHGLPSVDTPAHGLPSVDTPAHGLPSVDTPAHGLPSVDAPADDCTGGKPSMSAAHSDEELFSDDEVVTDLLLESSSLHNHDTDIRDNRDPDIADPGTGVTTMKRNRTCDQGSKDADPKFEIHKANGRHSHGSDDFEIVGSGSSTSVEDIGDEAQRTREEVKSRPVVVSLVRSPDKAESSQEAGSVKRPAAVSLVRSPDKTEPSQEAGSVKRPAAVSLVRSPDKAESSQEAGSVTRPVVVSPVRSPDKTESSQETCSVKRKRELSDQDALASPVLGRKISSRSLTPRAKQSHKRLKMATPNTYRSSPGHKESERSANRGASSPRVTKVLSDKYMKMSTPLDRSGQEHSVVEQDSLYITPIPKQRQRSTFMLVTPALSSQSQDLSMDENFVATPGNTKGTSTPGQEVLLHLDGSFMKQVDAGKRESENQTEDCPRTTCSDVENKNRAIGRSVNESNVALPGSDSESRVKSPPTKLSDGRPCSASPDRKSASPDRKSVGSSDSDLEIMGDNFQLLSQLSASPKFPNKISFRKIASNTRKLSRKRSLEPHRHGDSREGKHLEAGVHNRQEDTDVLVTETGDAAEKELAEKNGSPLDTDPQDNVGDVDASGDVWDGFDDMDAACNIDPVCDADTEESPQKRGVTTPGKKHYTHKKHISMDTTETTLATPGTSTGHSSSRAMSDDEESLPSPGRGNAGETTLDFEVPDADSFLWNDNNAPEMEPSPQVHVDTGRNLQQVAAMLTPVTTVSTKTARKLIPPSPFTPMPNYDNMNTPQLKQQVGKYGVRPVGKKRMVGLLKDIYHKTHQYETDSDYDTRNTSPQKPPDTHSKSTVAKEQARDRPSKSSVGKGEAGDRSSKSSVAKSSKSSVGKDGASTRTSKSSVGKEGGDRSSKCSVGQGRWYATVSAPESSASEEGSSQRSVTSSLDSGCSEVPEESFMVDDEEISASQQVNQQDIQQKLITFIRQRSDIHTKLMMYEPLELDWLKREIQEAGIKCPMQKLMDFLDEKCLTFTMKKMTKRNTNRRAPKHKKKVKLPAAAV